MKWLSGTAATDVSNFPERKSNFSPETLVYIYYRQLMWYSSGSVRFGEDKIHFDRTNALNSLICFTTAL